MGVDPRGAANSQALAKAREGARTRLGRRWNHLVLKSILARADKPSYLVAAGFSPSGLLHLGTVREVALADFIGYGIKRFLGRSYELKVFVDDMDPLTKVPEGWGVGEEALGVALCHLREKVSGAAAFVTAVEKDVAYLASLFPKATFIRMSEVYARGEMNQLIDQAVRSHQLIKKRVSQTMASHEDYMPVHAFGPDGKVVKEGRYKGARLITAAGELNLHDGGGKLQWRLDWSGRWYKYGVDFEPMGKDVHSSWEDCVWMCEHVWKCKPPVPFVFEYITVDKGVKMSKSKGNYPRVDTFTSYVPAWCLKHWLLIRPAAARQLSEFKLMENLDKVAAEISEYWQLTPEQRALTSLGYVFEDEVPLSFPSSLSALKVLKAIATFNLPERLSEEEALDYMVSKPQAWAMDAAFVASRRFREILAGLYRFYRNRLLKDYTKVHEVAHRDLKFLEDLVEKLCTNIKDEKIGELLRKSSAQKFLYPILCKAPSGPRFSELLSYNMRSYLIELLDKVASAGEVRVIEWERLPLS